MQIRRLDVSRCLHVENFQCWMHDLPMISDKRCSPVDSTDYAESRVESLGKKEG